MIWVSFILGGFLILSGALVVSVIVNGLLRSEKERWKSPFSEKLIRPAGESLRIRIEEIRSDLTDEILLFSVGVFGPGLLVLMNRAPERPLAWVVVAFVSIGLVSFAFSRWSKLKNLREKLRRVRLGFDGERYVAEELNRLMERGYRVFHDFVVDWHPGEGRTSNIDHVLVGPEGVFAVETKTRSKPKGRFKPGETPTVYVEKHSLRFEGEVAREDAVEQAKRGARELETWLEASGQGKVRVRPLVVIPGWYVKDVNYQMGGVKSAKGVWKWVPELGLGPRLSEREVQAIGNCLEMHCRNLEGA